MRIGKEAIASSRSNQLLCIHLPDPCNTITGKDGEKVRLAKRTEQHNSNLAYLSSIQWCIDRRCKLLGLDAPIKAQINAQLGVGEAEFNLEKMTTEELQAIANSSLN